MTGALEGFAVIGALIAVGYLLAATGVLEESSQVVLARLVYFVATPALLIEILGSTDLATVFGPWFLVAAIGVVAVLLVYVPWARWRGHPGKDVVVGGLASSFANSGYLGLPIAGDLRYGGGPGPRDLQRQFLHAARLTLDRPADGRRLTAWSELPADLAASLAQAGIEADGLPAGVGARLVDADG